MCWAKNKNKKEFKYILVSEDAIKEPYPYVFVDEDGSVRGFIRVNDSFLRRQCSQEMVRCRILRDLIVIEMDLVVLADIAFVQKYLLASR